MGTCISSDESPHTMADVHLDRAVRHAKLAVVYDAEHDYDSAMVEYGMTVNRFTDAIQCMDFEVCACKEAAIAKMQDYHDRLEKLVAWRRVHETMARDPGIK